MRDYCLLENLDDYKPVVNGAHRMAAYDLGKDKKSIYPKGADLGQRQTLTHTS